MLLRCCSSGKPLTCFSTSSHTVESVLIVHSFFKTLVDHEVTVELKNDISIRGILKSVDQFLNIKLDDIQVVEELKYPHLVCQLIAAFRRSEADLISLVFG